ncbi:hypothetical protein [Azorhizophilus paspali]|uniref:Uncharacterized protein n=1 Tax=Azorhizophilus paspali TaxID=69963 RepID=A0ABV6SIL1_AZOPA
MIGLADIGWSGSGRRNHPIVNHSIFFDAAENTVLDVELNYRSGHDGHVLLMPQIHHRLTRTVNLQFGIDVARRAANRRSPRPACASCGSSEGPVPAGLRRADGASARSGKGFRTPTPSIQKNSKGFRGSEGSGTGSVPLRGIPGAPGYGKPGRYRGVAFR